MIKRYSPDEASLMADRPGEGGGGDRGGSVDSVFLKKKRLSLSLYLMLSLSHSLSLSPTSNPTPASTKSILAVKIKSTFICRRKWFEANAR